MAISLAYERFWVNTKPFMWRNEVFKPNNEAVIILEGKRNNSNPINFKRNNQQSRCNKLSSIYTILKLEQSLEWLRIHNFIQNEYGTLRLIIF